MSASAVWACCLRKELKAAGFQRRDGMPLRRPRRESPQGFDIPLGWGIPEGQSEALLWGAFQRGEQIEGLNGQGIVLLKEKRMGGLQRCMGGVGLQQTCAQQQQRLFSSERQGVCVAGNALIELRERTLIVRRRAPRRTPLPPQPL